ncbi:MAG: ABC transporter ATP-binding protein [Bacillota bacterium]|nr:ABC transporter ATP-binding protein [Bacillota bacterium]
MAVEAVVEVRDLRYRYPGAAKPALDGVSLQLRRGEVVGLIGPTGAGKSTLCQALVGLVPQFYRGAVGGSVRLLGRDAQTTPVAELSRHAGLVFQNPFTQITGARLTVYEEVAFGLENAGIPREAMRRRIDRVLRLLGLDRLAERNPFTLSGGQMQRLAIASVLVLEPEVLVLDEPTSQLDPAGTREVFEALETIRRGGTTVLIAEQKVERLAAWADRLLLLDAGRLVAEGSPRQLFSREDLEARGVARPPVTAACRAHGRARRERDRFPGRGLAGGRRLRRSGRRL